MKLLISLLFLISILNSVKADYQLAHCSLVPLGDVQNSFSGYVQIYKNESDKEITFNYNINAVGFQDGFYGVTIDTYGYPVSNLGGVYNIDASEPGCPSVDQKYRVGDLNDINITKGIYNDAVKYQLPQLSGDNSIIGRSLVFYNSSICSNSNVFNKNTSIVATCVIGYANGTQTNTFFGVNTAAASTTQSANGVAVLYATTAANGSTINGLVSFNKVSDGVEILSGINGLTKEAHGFHIHAFGQFSDDGSALGGHWANSTQTHSLPTDNSDNRHFGDLGNICQFDAAFENAYYNFTTNYFSLNSLFGHGFAVHATRDLGTSNVGGARILQGVIAMVDPSVEIPSNVKPTTEHFKFDNICENGAQNGEIENSSSSLSSDSSNSNSHSSSNSNSHNSSSNPDSSSNSDISSDDGSTASNGTKIISSLFILGLFSSIFVLLL